MRKKSIVIIPIHNAAKYISTVITNLKLEIPSIHYVIIDDASTDKTVDICRDKNFNLISLKNHSGLNNAIQVGYKFALKHNYDYVIRYDGSGSYEPADILKLEKNIDNMFDIIIGNRFTSKRKSFAATILSNSIKKEIRKKINDPESGLLIITKKTAKNLIKNNGQKVTLSFIINQIKQGYTIKEVDINYEERENHYYKSSNTLQAIWLVIAQKLFKPFNVRNKKGE